LVGRDSVEGVREKKKRSCHNKDSKSKTCARKLAEDKTFLRRGGKNRVDHVGHAHRKN